MTSHQSSRNTRFLRQRTREILNRVEKDTSELDKIDIYLHILFDIIDYAVFLEKIFSPLVR